LGCDFSGVVEALGPGATGFFVGQPVFGHSGYGGALAELVVAPARCLAAKPTGVDDIEAAATPLCGLTAWQALFEVANLQSGQRILIHGGSGGVGMFAVQLALRQGARVIATASSRNLSFLRQLGAHQVIDYASTKFENVIEGVDVVLDLVGGETQDRSWNLLRAGGCLVSTVAPPSMEKASQRGVRAQKMTTQTRSDELTLIGELIANGEIKVIVEKVLPLCRAPEALEKSRGGHAMGKIVVTIDPDIGPPEFNLS
jgi:NADPH:quinone reductase-like Zn-dependent oxidoreductase